MAPPNPGLIFEMVNAHQRTAALKAAIELDVFRALGEGLDDAASIAMRCGSSERGMRILCDFLVINGLLQKVDGKYRHTPTSAVFLDPSSSASIASMAQFMNNPAIHAVYDDLAEVVRRGRTTLPGTGTVEPENPLWVEFAEKMAPFTGPMAGPLCAVVTAAQGGAIGPVRVLDIAAGHGLFGIEFAKCNPEATVTAVDWPAVLEVSYRNATAAGVGARYERKPGSAFDVEFAGPYDVVLLTNFLHHFDPPTCVGLLKKIHAALRPGGVVAALEFVPDECKTKPAAAAGFSMTRLTTTADGDAYSLSELRGMYEEAGFHDVKGTPLAMSPQTAVLGRV